MFEGLPDGDGYHDMVLPCGLFQERKGWVADVDVGSISDLAVRYHLKTRNISFLHLGY